MTWTGADAFCASRGKRLPTSVEWVYAACGVEGIPPWTAEAVRAACLDRWYSKPKELGTCEVGSRAQDRSPFGVLDMIGNVEEWTSTDGADHTGEEGKVEMGFSFHRTMKDIKLNRICSVQRVERHMPLTTGKGFRCAAAPLP